jgi:transposase
VFLNQPDFFDSHDLLQVHYELLRARLIAGDKIAGLCRRFGVSRQTFYNLQARFLERGSSGLLPGRPGPKGPSKLSHEVASFAEKELAGDEDISGALLASRIDAQLDVSLHKRTVEKLLKALRGKKTAEPLGEGPFRPWVAPVVSDRLRDRYEKLRERFRLEGMTVLQQDPQGRRFLLDGLLGLLRNTAERAYVVHVHEAPCRRWGDRTQHEDRVLLEALRILTGTRRSMAVCRQGDEDESSAVRPRILKDAGEGGNDRLASRGAAEPREQGGRHDLRGVCLPR